MDKTLKFTAHINNTSKIISRNIGIISRVRYYIDRNTAHILYNSMILPYLNYCCLIWGVNYYSQLQRLVILQKRAVRLIECVYPPISSGPLFKKYNILKVSDIARNQMIIVMHKFISKQLPTALQGLYQLQPDNVHITRQIKHLIEPASNRNYRLFTTSLAGPRLWNLICAPLCPVRNNVPSKYRIKKMCRIHFINTY